MLEYKDLTPSKVYRDVRTNKIIGVSYKSYVLNEINEALFSIENAQKLGLQDIDIVEYLDVQCINVLKGKMDMLFPIETEKYFNEELADDGITVSFDGQIIHGHVFSKFSGIQMDNEQAIERCLTNYEQQQS